MIHRFIPGGDPVLLLLHGTGGNEEDLIPAGQSLLPDAAILSVRGMVLENGMPRFFKRLAEGVFDQDDLRLRTDELAQFIGEARQRYGLRENPIVAAGYSNGANMAASLILRYPRHLAGAVLFRAMVPFRPDTLPGLAGLPVFLSAGLKDPIVPQANTRELAGIFEAAGAQVSIHWHPGGHELGADDLEAARLWLRQTSFSAPLRLGGHSG